MSALCLQSFVQLTLEFKGDLNHLYGSVGD